ncbi:restriction endonuclease subunit S [Burkholderia vietnamiensis]|uniref:restriction endonuclease subunit S n=1 Tax=Burkholderia vietnamiensis TaxID=60552 RepID=UPI0009BD5172|nr:restriction endonuclease subunit S [Burkholderia vietnamiensis]MCA8072084.1 restriction endonuclease subunit S [Burkholderia vietnamiensis]MCA8290693.1 restriction endonuclease subunit S [Burkholderia vietnamiensis]
MSLPTYPSYKDSGVEWLGAVPSHWEVLSIKRLSPVQRGASPRPIDDPKYFDDNGEYAWVRIADVSASDGVLTETAQRLSELGANLSVKLGLGQLFVSIAGTVGKPCISAIKACIHDGFVYFPNLAVPPRFLFRIFEAGLCYGGLGKWGTQLNLNTDTIGAIKVALPPADELTSILDFIDRETSKIDALIAEQEKLLELLAEKRQATISHAVTRGLNPDVPMKDSGVEWLGMVPKHWKVIPLKYLVTLRSGGTPSKDNLDYWDGDVPWASAKDLKVERLSDTTDHITEYAVEAGAAALVPAGAILVVVRGMILARTFPVVVTLRAMAINQDLKAIIPRKSLSAPFLALLLRGSEGESLQRLDEAGHGTKALRMDAWTSMQLPIPPLDEQADIAKFVEQEITKLDGLKAEAARAIDLLKERRSALISAAVTGKINVHEHTSALAAAA